MNIVDITTKKQETDKPIRLAAYCRVSSNSEDQLHSFAAQIRYYSEYTHKHPEYQLVDIYADEGLSGTDIKKRDEQNRLIDDCEKGKIDRIIVKSVSRFARNTEELLVTLRLLKSIGVSVYFEEQDIDTEKLNLEMMVTFPGIMAQQESRSISENMRWSYQKRMQSGEFNSCKPAYGFEIIHGKLAPRTDEMRIVQKIFDMYLNGMGTQSIANFLNEKGVPRRYGTEKWHASTIRYILSNERYMGDAVLQKSFTTETLPFKKIKNKGQKTKYYIENSNPAIISKSTYSAAYELRKSKKRHSGGCHNRYFLSGMLKCAECGRVFRRQTINKKGYWECGGKPSMVTNCKCHGVMEDVIYKAFINMIYKLHDNRKELIGTLIKQIQNMQTKICDAEGVIRQIDKQLADLSAQNLVIARLYRNGILNDTEYSEQTSKIGNKITELRIQKRKKLSEDEDNKWLHGIKELDEIIKNLIPKNMFDEKLFKEIVESIIVKGNSKLTFKLIGGIELTELINNKGRGKRYEQ